MKRAKTFIMIFLFFLGICILLYPEVSDYYNKKVQLKEIKDYETILDSYNEVDYSSYFSEAKAYNDKLRKMNDPYMSYEDLKNYNKILNTNGKGMIGYITIDKINVKLPIYHGTNEEVLNMSVGHLEGSSFPIGGVGTHSVLSAHRGLPSAKLFTNLDKLVIGDNFTISVLNETYLYKIDHIVVVKPDDLSHLKINNNKDYVTLMTCTPYGINSHRLLVRGERILNLEESLNVTNEVFKINNNTIIFFITFILLLIVLLIVILKPSKNNKLLIERYVYPSKYKNSKGGKL